jgi:RING finger/CHY zinc finger protein 1
MDSDDLEKLLELLRDGLDAELSRALNTVPINNNPTNIQNTGKLETIHEEDTSDESLDESLNEINEISEIDDSESDHIIEDINELVEDDVSDDNKYGCKHYVRKCQIISPCCNKVFTCRLCHDESMYSNNLSDDAHKINRFDIKRIICLICGEEQDVHQNCSKCNACFSEYFCNICNLFDKYKGQVHCSEDGCNMCRVGSSKNDKMFHCKGCNCCLHINLLNNHECKPHMLNNNCPICYEDLSSSTIPSSTLKCGHLMHRTCLNEYLEHDYICPLCSKSIVDASKLYKHIDKHIDKQIEDSVMEDSCRPEINILCNDCNTKSTVKYHILGQKCGSEQCGSYNTKRIK